ncbi:ABC transporter substrate-binding protein [Nostoc sp. CHAB 5844]|nr:ABC transporter substrate-binding protein [Nostoc sp. CHAB 5844]
MLTQIIGNDSRGFLPLAKLLGAIALVALPLIICISLVFRHQQPADNSPIQIALAAPLTGQEMEAGQEMVQSVQMYLDMVNQEGGINGHPLKLLSFDDAADKKVAKARAPEIVASPAVVLLGHRSSSPSATAGKIYGAAHLPAITGTSNDDEVTLENPYYFRATYTRSLLYRIFTIYFQQVLKFPNVSIIQYDAYGEKLAQDFTKAFTSNGGIVKHLWGIDPQKTTQSIQQIVEELVADPDAGVVYLAMRGEEQAEKLLVNIKRRGLRLPILLSQPLSREEFARRFENYAEEKKNPGFFTNGIYATSPLLFDSAGADAQDFGNKYQALYGKLPSYVGTKFYEAATLAVEAIRNAKIQNIVASRTVDRDRVYVQLKKINNRKVAVRGVTGLLYFEPQTRSNINQPVRMAQFYKRILVSAPRQFESVSNLERENLQRELQAGNIIQIDNDYFWRQSVVYTGLDINKLSRIDQKTSSFTAEFYLWFRYAGDIDISSIDFPDGKNTLPNQPIFNPADFIESSTIDGLKYRLYQLRGEFKSSFDLHDYPFDRQKLTIRFQNTNIPSDRLIYAIDTFGLRLPITNTVKENNRYSLQTWTFKGIQYAKETFRTTSTEGNPRLFNTDNRVDYPGLSTTIIMQRRPLVFLIKNSLPLILLTLVPMMTLYFPTNLVKERPPVAVSALISGTVLLVGVYNQLPDVGYTVAIEYIFYVFFGLSLFSILVGILSDRLILQGYKILALRIDLIAKIIYVITMLITVTIYWVAFSERFV